MSYDITGSAQTKNLYSDFIQSGNLTLTNIQAKGAETDVLHITGSGVITKGTAAGGGSDKKFFWGARTTSLGVNQASNTQIPFVQLNASVGDWTVVGGNSLRYDGLATRTFAVELLACLQYSGLSMVDGIFYLQVRRNGNPLATGSGVVTVSNMGGVIETVMARSVTIMNTTDTLTFFATCNGSDATMLDVSYSAGGVTYSSEPCTILVTEVS